MHTAELDYRFPNTTNITFPIGSEVGTTECLTLEIIDDDVVENGYKNILNVELSEEPGADVSPYSCTISIYEQYSDCKLLP